MNTQKYNGWANYETWLVNMWIEETDHDALIEDDLIENGIDFTYDESDVKQCVDDMIDRTGFDTGASSIVNDLVTSALGEVDWREISEVWNKTAKEITDYRNSASA